VDKTCQTKKLKLVGSENLDKNLKIDNLGEDITTHLIKMYGDNALNVYNSAASVEKLHEDYSYINAEVIYAIKEEFVKKPLDFIVRRTSLALIDIKIAKEILEKVLLIMQKELNWDESTVGKEREEAIVILNKAI